jgi:hypothetical protein
MSGNRNSLGRANSQNNRDNDLFINNRNINNLENINEKFGNNN